MFPSFSWHVTYSGNRAYFYWPDNCSTWSRNFWSSLWRCCCIILLWVVVVEISVPTGFDVFNSFLLYQGRVRYSHCILVWVCSRRRGIWGAYRLRNPTRQGVNCELEVTFSAWGMLDRWNVSHALIICLPGHTNNTPRFTLSILTSRPSGVHAVSYCGGA